MQNLLPSDPSAVGPYRLLGRIGSGGMGVVYLARDPNGSLFAVKVIRPELADDAAFRSRFKREVRAAQLVGGRGTARLVDFDLGVERPYLVSEYVEAGSLADYVATHGPLAGDDLVGLAVGLAEALVAIHAAGIVHRDLKPSNVLMAPSGPRVVDFGVAQTVEATALTQSGLVLGSPSWMAPEQAAGQEVTAAADVFAWGATIAYTATGR